jgi:hypothetical protein
MKLRDMGDSIRATVTARKQAGNISKPNGEIRGIARYPGSFRGIGPDPIGLPGFCQLNARVIGDGFSKNLAQASRAIHFASPRLLPALYSLNERFPAQKELFHGNGSFI